LTLDSITLEQLPECRPDLVSEIERAGSSRLEQAQAQLAAMVAREETQRRRERILQLLEEHDLPLPCRNGAAESQLVSPQFVETLLSTEDDDRVRSLIEERAALVRSAFEWRNTHHAPSARRPRSRDQIAIAQQGASRSVSNAQEFAASIRG
jgi:hypothetical protein